MNAELITEIKKLFESELIGNEIEEESDSLSVKLQDILASNDGQQRQEIVTSIKAFLNGNEIQKRKLMSFCLDFKDPTFSLSTCTQNGREVRLNTLLQEDELYKLYQFVKRHTSDSTFGDTVYKVMNDHNLNAPQVYKAAKLRRQDFSRATDPKVKNVTKQIAWQIIIGLHCNIEEADEVLFSAGYIRRKTKFDLTMEYFIRHQNYDIIAINFALDEFGLKVFSCYTEPKDSDVGD